MSTKNKTTEDDKPQVEPEPAKSKDAPARSTFASRAAARDKAVTEGTGK